MNEMDIKFVVYMLITVLSGIVMLFFYIDKQIDLSRIQWPMLVCEYTDKNGIKKIHNFVVWKWLDNSTILYQRLNPFRDVLVTDYYHLQENETCQVKFVPLELLPQYSREGDYVRSLLP